MHISRDHKGFDTVEDDFKNARGNYSEASFDYQCMSLDDNAMEYSNGPDETQIPVNQVNPEEEQSERGCMKEYYKAQFILSLRAKSIPEHVIQQIMENTECLIRLSVDEFSEEVEDALRRKGVELQEILNISRMKDKCSTVFSNLETKHKQNAYFK